MNAHAAVVCVCKLSKHLTVLLSQVYEGVTDLPFQVLQWLFGVTI